MLESSKGIFNDMEECLQNELNTQVSILCDPRAVKLCSILEQINKKTYRKLF